MIQRSRWIMSAVYIGSGIEHEFHRATRCDDPKLTQ